ncbi:MAG: glycerol-3-phosphate dehydrogenase, partial [Clostridia bacterium]|nr:glycerol-3-phosphate dehydrogenase [Clostridia bacterium]
MKQIGVLNAGTWAVALARLLERNGHAVTVWSKFQQEVDQLSTTRKHPN